MERALQKILNTTDLIKEFNMDVFVRSIIISVIKNPPPSMKEKSETSSALHSPNTEDLPPKKKKKLISVTNSPPAVPQKLKIKMSPAAAITPDAGMGQIVAGFVPAKNTSMIRIFQVRLLCGLDDNFVRTADPWPKNPLNPSFWDISINSFVDYMAFKYTKEDFHVGEFVYALFCLDMKKRTMSSEFYPGRVAEIAEETIKIEYEDTDVQAVKYDQLFKMSDVKDQSLVTPPKFSKPIEEF